MKMKNNYLICEVPEKIEESYAGFQVKDLSLFQTVKVLHSAEEDIPEGCLVKISVNAGGIDKDGLIIKRTDVIHIV